MKNIFKLNIKGDRIYGLDILRCVAILFVVFEHGNFLLPEKTASFMNYLVMDGVSIFFVLSGFLIGGILIKQFEKKDISFKVLLNFWKRRWFRTLPNYFLILSVLVVLYYLFINNFTLRGVNRYFFFSQNLYSPQPAWFFPESWSLSVEEWFYLLIPILILLLSFTFKLSKNKAIVTTAILLIIAVTAFRFYRFLNVSVLDVYDWDLIFRKQVVTRLDSLMFGVIGAYICYYYNTYWLKYKNILFITGIFLLLITQCFSFANFGSMYYCVFSFSLNGIGVLLLLPYLNDIKHGNGRVYKWVTSVSLMSYSMYLINLSIVRQWLIDTIHISKSSIHPLLVVALKYGLYWCFTIVLSLLIYKYFEVPTTKLRDKKHSSI